MSECQNDTGGARESRISPRRAGALRLRPYSAGTDLTKGKPRRTFPFLLTGAGRSAAQRPVRCVSRKGEKRTGSHVVRHGTAGASGRKNPPEAPSHRLFSRESHRCAQDFPPPCAPFFPPKRTKLRSPLPEKRDYGAEMRHTDSSIRTFLTIETPVQGRRSLNRLRISAFSFQKERIFQESVTG